MPDIYIIAGCNGAGKTTASYTFLPNILKVKEFVNANEIAKGLSPFQPEKASLEAGRIMLKRIHELIEHEEDFAFETTLSTISYRNLITAAKEKGYKVNLIFIWLHSVKLAKERVRIRVANGGHNIPSVIIERRYYRGLNNFFLYFKGMVDYWTIIDNSDEKPQVIATFSSLVGLEVKNDEIWNQIQSTNEPGSKKI